MTMKTMSIEGIPLFFEAAEQEAADLIADACRRSIPVIRESWRLTVPDGCRLYVMTSWRDFMFDSASPGRRILLRMLYPLWAPRARRMWPHAGGWTQPYRSGPVVGVKPPHLLGESERSIGARIFCPEASVADKVRHNTCHELTHAFAGHLALPAWLNEGLALVTVDRFAGKATVQPETVQALVAPSRETRPRSYRRLTPADQDAMVYHVVRGYWITNYLEERQPGLLRALLTKRYPHSTLEGKIAAALGMSRETFWQQIDEMLVSHWQEADPS
jgi:hypothetical protein